jgi:hypothetical protein
MSPPVHRLYAVSVAKAVIRSPRRRESLYQKGDSEMDRREALVHGLVRHVGALALAGVLVAGMAAAVHARPAATFTYYDNGAFKTESRSKLKASEEEAKQGGHMPWRRDAASVASVMTADLLPPAAPGEKAASGTTDADGKTAVLVVAPSWRAEYLEAEERADRAVIDLRVNGEPSYRLTLARPFGYWWYVTGVEPQRAGAGPAVEARREYCLGVREALEGCGFTVAWHAADRSMSVTGKRITAVLHVGSNKATIDGRVTTWGSPVKVVKGRACANSSLIATIIGSDAAAAASATGQVDHEQR